MTSTTHDGIAHLEDEDGLFDDDVPSDQELAEEESICAHGVKGEAAPPVGNEKRANTTLGRSSVANVSSR